MRRSIVLAATVCLFLAAPPSLHAAYVPWTPPLQYDATNGDNWVHATSGVETFSLNPINSGPVLCTFDIKNTDGSARGMNAVKFQYGGQNIGHMTSDLLTDSFQVLNAPKGSGQTFHDILLMVAINTPSLDAGWSMTLNGYTLTPADFGYVDGSAAPTGRPSGYYPDPEPITTGFSLPTTPSRDELSYIDGFTKGMVSIYEFSGLNMAKGGSLNIDYSFSSLPGDVTFSAYATLLDLAGNPSIKHTNRAFDDALASDDFITTFSVLAPEQVQSDVPEPATMTAIGVCLAALGGYIRRRR